jgi:hypothetical protein
LFFQKKEKKIGRPGIREMAAVAFFGVKTFQLSLPLLARVCYII